MPNQTEFDESVERALGIGWEVCDDGTYTSASPLTIASAKTQITLDCLGGSTNKDYLPEGVASFWDGTNNKIVAERVGDAFDVRFGFKAKSSAVNSYFDVTFDIGDPSGIVIAGQTKIAPKGAGVETQYTIDIPIYALSTFITNGCKIWVDTTASAFTLSMYDMTLFIKRDYTNAP